MTLRLIACPNPCVKFTVLGPTGFVNSNGHTSLQGTRSLLRRSRWGGITTSRILGGAHTRPVRVGVCSLVWNICTPSFVWLLACPQGSRDSCARPPFICGPILPVCDHPFCQEAGRLRGPTSKGISSDKQPDCTTASNSV